MNKEVSMVMLYSLEAFAPRGKKKGRDRDEVVGKFKITPKDTFGGVSDTDRVNANLVGVNSYEEDADKEGK